MPSKRCVPTALLFYDGYGLLLVEYLQRLEYRCVDGVVVGIEAVVLQFRVAADLGTQQGAQQLL